MHVAEFKRMNANINVEKVVVLNLKVKVNCKVHKVKRLIEAAAALILAGLVADGKTSVTELTHLDRGDGWTYTVN
ncbi:hypothetical protein ACVPOQ_04410 [Staphylococcus aureus]